MMRFFALLLITLAPQLCFAGPPMKFAWGNSKAYVTETVEKNKGSVTYRYMIELVKKKDGVMLQQNFVELVAMNGQKVPNQNMGRKFGALARFPQLLIDAHGDIIEVVNEEKFIKTYTEAMPGEQARAMFSQPSFREVLFMQFYQKWCLWVCMWNDPELTESHDVVTTEEIEFLGNVMPQKTTIRHHGFLPDQPHLVKLTLHSTTEIDQAEDFVENVAEELGQTIKPEPLEKMPSSLSKESYVEALMEPNTLKPHQIIMTAKTTVTLENREESKDEKHTFTFEWN